ncbi:peptidoglycan-binding domain-containing protein [Niallia sp. NCCP-28]
MGFLGAKTEDALRRFQSVYCNPVDGIYGAKTCSAMLTQLNK